MISLNVNGKTHKVKVEPDTPLLWVLREQLGLTGTKYGCGIAQCGSCTVLIDGDALRSCALSVSAAQGKTIRTVEDLASSGQLTKIQKAWVDNQASQCGYCQSGMVMASTALLEKNPNPTDADIDAAMTNICRCGTYQEVRRAIRSVSQA